MLRIYTGDEIQDKKKSYSGDLKFGTQKILNNKCEYFEAKGNNSAIVSFTAVEINGDYNEVERTVLNVDLILTDVENSSYYLDVSQDFSSKLTKGIYFFEFTNSIEVFKSEIVEVVELTVEVTFTIDFSSTNIQHMLHDIDIETTQILFSAEIDTVEYSINEGGVWSNATGTLTFDKNTTSWWRVSAYLSGSTGTMILKGKQT